jgi:hypothetical protein
MLAIFAGMSLLALGFPTKAGFMPLLVGIPGTLLCAIQLGVDIWRDSHGGEAEVEDSSGEQAPPDPTAKSEKEMFVWVGIFAAGLLAFGFVAGGTVLVFLYVKIANRDPFRDALFSAMGTFAVLYGVFIWLLELTLFEGFVIRAFL